MTENEPEFYRLRVLQAQRENEILLLSSQVQDTTKTLDSELTSSISYWRNEVEQFNVKTLQLKNSMSQVVATITQSANEISSWFFGQVKFLNRWLYALLFLSIAATAGAFGYFYGIGLILLIPTLILAVSFLALVHFAVGKISDSMQDKLDEDFEPMLGKANYALGVFHGSTLKSTIKFENMANFLKKLTQYSNSIAQATQPLIASVVKYNSEINRLNEQGRFLRTMRNSALNWGMVVGADSEELLAAFGSKSVRETDWLSELAPKFAESLGIHPLALELLYHSYNQNSSSIRGAWERLKVEPIAVQSLSEVIIKKEQRTYANPTSISDYAAFNVLLVERPKFDVQELRDLYYKFYIEIAEAKLVLIDRLSAFGFDIQEFDRLRIREYVPTSAAKEKWVEKLFEFSSTVIGQPKEITALIFLEQGSANLSEDAWLKVIGNQKISKPFLKLLLEKRKVTVPDAYMGDLEVLLECLARFAQEPSLQSLTLIRQRISDYFIELERIKKTLLRSIDGFGYALPLGQHTTFDSFIPPSGEVLGSTIKRLEELLKSPEIISLDEKLIKLFYYYRIKDDDSLQEIFEEIQVSDSLKLATILLTKGTIDMEKGSELGAEARNLAIVIAAAVKFDPISIQNRYQSYGNIATMGARAEKYLEQEELVNRPSLSFSDIAELMKGPDLELHFSRIEAIIKSLLMKYSTIQMRSQEANGTVLACTTSFLVTQQDFAGLEACKRSYADDLAKRILYHHMILKEGVAMGSSARAKLFNAVEDVLNGIPAYDFLPDFEVGLLNGRLYQNTAQMFRDKKEGTKSEFENISKIKAELEETRVSFRGFLNTKLPEDALKFAIDSGLVKAYMVSTKAHRGKIISDIIDIRMKTLAQKQASDDSTMRTFLILTEEKTIGGRSTRIGVVPPGMDFEGFASRFQTLFELAVDEYLEERHLPSTDAMLFSANVFRIFASEQTFRLITGAKLFNETQVKHPVDVIRDLILDRFGIIDTLELTASLTPDGERTILAKRLVVNMLNECANLFLMIRTEIGEITARHNALRRLMQEKSGFDQMLFSRFDSPTFSEFAYTIHKRRDRDTVETANSLEIAIETITHQNHIQLEQKESHDLAAAIMTTIGNIGQALDY